MSDKPHERIDQFIARVKANCEAATDGPWEDKHGMVWGYCPLIDRSEPKTEGITGKETHDYDRKFIASSRTDLPRALAALEYACEILNRVGVTPDDRYLLQITAILNGEGGDDGKA